MNTGVVEEVDPIELTYERIRARSDAFNHAFASNGGYKGYEVQAIESLLAQLRSAHETMQGMAAQASEARQLRQQVDDWHRIADERAAEIVRLQSSSEDMGFSSDA